MRRTNPRPAPLTLLFYVAFAASYVQDRYTSPDFYPWIAGEFFEIGLGLLTLTAFLVLTLGAFIRSVRAGGFPWWHMTAAIGALMTAEVVWRFGVNGLPGMGFKDVALVIDVAKPIVAALGVAAIIAERRRRVRSASTPHHVHEATI